MQRSELQREVVLAHLELVTADAARGVESGWIDQKHSPIGRRRHVMAVRRRVQTEGAGRSAAIIGRRYLLRLDALADEYFATRYMCGWRSVLGARPANDNGRAA